MSISAQRRRIFLATYRAARTSRYGLHNPRGKTLNHLRQLYQEEYLSNRRKAGPLDCRYRDYVADIEERNKKIKEERGRRLGTIERNVKQLEDKKEEAVKKFGYREACRMFDHLIFSAYFDPYLKKLQPKDIASRYAFEKYLDIFASLDRYIRHKLHKIGSEWCLGDEPLSPQQQYQRKVIYCSIGAPGGADANKKRALKYARGFHAHAMQEVEQLAALLKKQKAKRSRSHAQQTNQVAKIIVGEKVRHPNSFERTHQRLHCNHSLVNKVGTLLAYFDEHKVASQDVPALLSQKEGGIEALLKEQRAAKTR